MDFEPIDGTKLTINVFTENSSVASKTSALAVRGSCTIPAQF